MPWWILGPTVTFRVIRPGFESSSSTPELGALAGKPPEGLYKVGVVTVLT